MRKLARRLFTLCAAASLVLCIAVCVLWSSSHAGPAGVIVLGGPADHMLDSQRGSVTYVRQAHDESDAADEELRGQPFVFWADRYRQTSMSQVSYPADNPKRAYYQTQTDGFRTVRFSPPPYTDRPSWADPGEVIVMRRGNDSQGFGVRGAWDRWGIFLAADDFPDAPVTHHLVVSLPHRLIALGFALLPAVVVLRRLRAVRARRHGRCAICGYDLRATPGRCPECDTAAAAAVAATAEAPAAPPG